MRLAEALDDCASFRRFCGFAGHEPTPERTAFVRFRAALVRLGLDRPLFEAITRQLDAHGVVVRTGTLVDATLIASASVRRDAEARWVGHRRRKPVHGYKAHVATDQDAGLIRGVEVTTANVHDAAELNAICPGHGRSDGGGPTPIRPASVMHREAAPARPGEHRGGTPSRPAAPGSRFPPGDRGPG